MQNCPVEINLKSIKPKLINTLSKYHLYHINETFEKNESKEKQEIIQRIKNSNLVIIDKFICKEKGDIFHIIGFNKTIIIFQDSSKEFIQFLFSNNSQLKFYFIKESKDIFDQNNEITKNQLFHYSEKLDEEIQNFNKCFKINYSQEDQIHQIENSIKSCISGYLIGESYFKKMNEQKIDQLKAFNKDTNKKSGEQLIANEWTDEDYIELKKLGHGSFSIVFLIYHIETGQLFAMKKPCYIDNEIPKLYKREYDNYLKINYPLIPKLYGKQKENNCLFIQYIHGQTLNNIDIQKLTLEDKITIIVEIMLIIQYIHDNKFVYRDLKLNNVIVYENKTAFLIDFD